MRLVESWANSWRRLPGLVRVGLALTPLAAALILMRNLVPAPDPADSAGAKDRSQLLLFLLLVLLLCFLLICALWIVRFVEARNQRRKNERLSSTLQSRMETAGQPGEQPDFEERLRRHQADVHQALRSRHYDYYSFPWYLIIGASQSGKTTAIQRSNQEFPIGPKPVVDYGGTKGCNWFFTNKAIIIDTAGRYVEHLGAGPEEWNTMLAHNRAEWDAFLRLLVQQRPRAPINGILIAIRVPDLLDPDPRRRERLTDSLRKGLLEIEEKLGIRAPVYVLVTMCDLLSGFVDYCEHLPGLSDRTLLGWSRKGDHETPLTADEITLGLRHLGQRLDDLLPAFLEEEHSRGPLSAEDQQRVDRIVAFPEELRSVERPLHEVLTKLFAGSAYHDMHFLRGVYFTSGVQRGKPIARAATELLGERANALVALGPQTKEDDSKAYFIADLFEELIFRESGLVRQSTRAKRAVTVRRRAYMIPSVAIAVLFAVWVLWQAILLARLPTRIQGVLAKWENLELEDSDVVALGSDLDQLIQRERFLFQSASSEVGRAFLEIIRVRLAEDRQRWLDQQSAPPQLGPVILALAEPQPGLPGMLSAYRGLLPDSGGSWPAELPEGATAGLEGLTKDWWAPLDTGTKLETHDLFHQAHKGEEQCPLAVKPTEVSREYSSRVASFQELVPGADLGVMREKIEWAFRVFGRNGAKCLVARQLLTEDQVEAVVGLHELLNFASTDVVAMVSSGDKSKSHTEFGGPCHTVVSLPGGGARFTFDLTPDDNAAADKDAWSSLKVKVDPTRRTQGKCDLTRRQFLAGLYNNERVKLNPGEGRCIQSATITAADDANVKIDFTFTLPLSLPQKWPRWPQ